MEKDYSTFLSKIKGVFVDPIGFFDYIKTEDSIWPAFEYYAVLSIIPIAISYFIMLIMGTGLYGQNPSYAIFSTMLGGAGIVFVFIALYLLLLIISFIGVAIIHIFAILLKCNGKYRDTYKAVMYGLTPQMLLGWIPIVSLITILYSLYLQIKGMSILHDVSMGRAFVVIIAPGIVILAIIIIIAAFLLFGMFSLETTSMMTHML